MQQQTDYDDLDGEVRGFLAGRTERLQALGVQASRIVLDPGFGFAKTAAQNIALQRAWALRPPAQPWLAGWSRKSTLGWLSGAATGERLPGSLAAALAAVAAGARVLRVHDVGATVQALRVGLALGIADNPAPN